MSVASKIKLALMNVFMTNLVMNTPFKCVDRTTGYPVEISRSQTTSQLVQESNVFTLIIKYVCVFLLFQCTMWSSTRVRRVDTK